MLSVIITHYRTPEILKLALEYFERACSKTERRWEIIVTDSGTQSNTRDAMAEFPGFIYLPEEKNIGYAKSVNRGIRIAGGDFIFIANADLIVSDPLMLKTLLAYMQEHPDVGIVGPQLLNFNGTVQPSAFRYYTPATIIARRTFLGKLPWGKRLLKNFALESITANLNWPIPVDWLMGSALLIRKSALEKVGLLDENFFMYMEDVDWCRRFWEHGCKVIYNPETSAYHYHFQASKKTGGLLDILLNPYTRMHARSAFVYFKKYGLSAPNHCPLAGSEAAGELAEAAAR